MDKLKIFQATSQILVANDGIRESLSNITKLSMEEREKHPWKVQHEKNMISNNIYMLETMIQQMKKAIGE